MPLDAESHGEALWKSVGGSEHAPLWSYLPDGPFLERDAFLSSLRDKAASAERVYFAILDQLSGRAVGYVCLMRIDVAHGVIEVGSVLYSTRAAAHARRHRGHELAGAPRVRGPRQSPL